MTANGTLIEGRTGSWEIILGLEVHAQVVSKSKLFSGAATEFGAEPNTQVSLVDAAMPGMLPVINEVCVEQAVKTGLGLNAQINLRSVFDRKNYFYADLPAGYQISQYLQPIVGKGTILLDLPEGRTREVGITRLHLEQDAGKSLHDQHPTKTYIDLNRSGVALMEIVSEPDMRSAEEAAAYLRKLRSIMRYLGTCDGNMEEGSMRCDVNVSVRKPGEALGTRCEIKNVNSIRFVQQAIEYESRRQVEVIEEGGTIRQETRLFDSGKGITRPMRSKEHAHDYRYFPDPDLLPLELDPAWVARLKAALPELPDAKKARFIRDWGLSAYDAGVLVGREGERRLLRGRRQGPRSQAGRQLDDQRAVRPLNKAGKSHHEIAGLRERARRPRRPHRRQHHLRPHRQGRLRRDVRDRQARRRDRRDRRACARSPTPAPSRPDRRRSWPPTPTRSRNTAPARRSCSASSSARSMTRHGRQGQSGHAERAAEEEARGLTRRKGPIAPGRASMCPWPHAAEHWRRRPKSAGQSGCSTDQRSDPYRKGFFSVVAVHPIRGAGPFDVCGPSDDRQRETTGRVPLDRNGDEFRSRREG